MVHVRIHSFPVKRISNINIIMIIIIINFYLSTVIDIDRAGFQASRA